MKKQIKRVIYDIVGVVLILISPIVGSVPGPGGIALFLAGLGLLAVHNDWAKSLLHKAKTNSEHLLDIIFSDNPKIKLVHDFIGAGLFIAAIIVFMLTPAPFSYTIPIMLISASIFWLFYNRKRYKLFFKHKHIK
jgi:hypothetical protein